MSTPLQTLSTLLSPSETHHPPSPTHASNSTPWSAHPNHTPSLVLTPSSLPSLQKTLSHLHSHPTLDFAIRNTGTGSATAPDVVISMANFKSFSFSEDSETVTLGAGLDWGEVEILMVEHAKGWVVPGARCGWVGVAGGTLVGGYSWLGHEFGLISDPQNLLDVKILLRDGRCVWAGEEDGELLWGLRGGGGNFGVVVEMKFRARRSEGQVFAGLVMLPYERLGEVGEWTAGMVRRAKEKAEPKMAFAVANQGPGVGVPVQGKRPGVAVVLFDALGEEHARSKEVGFGELFEMDGLEEAFCGMVPLSGMTALADGYRSYQGVNRFWLSAPLVEEVDAGLIGRAWEFYERSCEACPELEEGSTVLFEFMQQGFFNSSGSRNATAWPHSGSKHVMQVVLGCKAGNGPPNLEEIAQQRLRVADTEIAGPGKETGEFHAGFLHDWNDLSKVYGENLERLVALKRKYDPENRFNKSVNLGAELAK